MELIQTRPHLSRNLLLRVLVLTLFCGMALYWQYDTVYAFYFDDRTTQTGLVVNGAIVFLFFSGYLQVIAHLLQYHREEAAVVKFVSNIKATPRSPLIDVPPRSLIAMRYKAILSLYEQKTPFQHGAFAAALMASESGKNSLLKYINNILILIGVFGTIISLSIALVGASNLLENINGMGLIIQGMSTALSTTLTAIVCFIFFSYLYTHVMDVQTNLVSTIEQVTTTYLLPRYQVQADNILFEVSGLIRSLQTITNEMSDAQRHLVNIEAQFTHAVEHSMHQVNHISDDLATVKSLLRQGFRLPEES